MGSYKKRIRKREVDGNIVWIIDRDQRIAAWNIFDLGGGIPSGLFSL